MQSRYPGDYVEISEREYTKAVKLAERVYDWVKELEIICKTY